MGGPKTRGLRRGIAFAAVVALHAGLVILTVAFRTPTSPSASREFITALIFLSAPLHPVASSKRRRPQVSNETSPVAPVEPPIAPPPVISFAIGADTAIDWAAEARRAAPSRLRAGTTALIASARSRYCAHRQRTKQVSSIELRTAGGLSGSAIVATSSLRSPHLGCRRSWRVPSLQERCVRGIRSLGATCSKTCRRTGSITRSRATRGFKPHAAGRSRRAARTPPARAVPTSAVLPAPSVSRVLCGFLRAPLGTERPSRQTPGAGR